MKLTPLLTLLIYLAIGLLLQGADKRVDMGQEESNQLQEDASPARGSESPRGDRVCGNNCQLEA